MSLAVAIVADDLTGALDTATPFADAGLSVAVAIGPQALGEAMARRPDVVAVNTASRALSPEAAARCVAAVAETLRAAAPALLMKKIDSRLKGNVASESVALATAFDCGRILVAPAVPDQCRATRGGAVIGHGVPSPLPIAPLFAGYGGKLHVADAGSDADLDALVAATDWAGTLAVGARGLGCALARRVAAGRTPGPRRLFRPSAATLFAFGSRDPITARQIDRLLEVRGSVTLVDAVNGHLGAALPEALPAILRCTGALDEPAGRVASRFAIGVARMARLTAPDMLMMGGGDTALAILDEIGARVLVPEGEVAPGMPWFTLSDAKGRRFACGVKSGGFGHADSLLHLVAEEAGLPEPARMRRDDHG
ncbi:four-carbon acid sugar kinase family protein [Ensifer soli]|uniref:four-carbon acid sugar kinase family protein n=1 Tax=Ciceribacter sp. sgz301302 TaxID=3342379 RepID=UPI0035BA0F58